MMDTLFEKTYAGKKVLITGNTGFKGAWLSVWLNHLGAKVYGISIDIPTQPSLFEHFALNTVVQHHMGDVRDAAFVRQTFQAIQPDFVFHMAAQPLVKASFVNPGDTFSTNVMGTVAVLDALRQAAHPCVAVMITSDKCYENVEWTWGYRENDRLGGKDPYSASKAGAENAIHAYYHSYFAHHANVKLASVRAGNVIGGGDWALDRIVPDAMRAWNQRQPLTIRNPQATRPWQHVLEPLSGYLNVGAALATQQIASGEAFNFGPNSNQNKTVLELLTSLSAYWNFAPFSEMVLVTPSHHHEAGLLKLSIDKAYNLLGWQPVLEFEQTVKYTAEWYYHFYQTAGFSLDFLSRQIEDYVQRAAEKNIPWSKA